MFTYFRGRRSLQILLFGFMIITIYFYYRTTIEDYHPFTEFTNATSNLLISQRRSIENGNGKLLSTLTKNKTFEIGTNSSFFNNSNNSSIEAGSPSTSGFQLQSSISSTSNNLSINNSTIVQHESKLISDNSTVSLNIHNDTTRAIYQGGYDVAIPEKCPSSGKDMNLVIIVMSAPTHIEARTAIRQTWGHFGQRTDVSIVFMLGATTDMKLNKLLQYEQKLYADIIRGQFIDSYSNLTLKTVSALEWINTYCSHAKFILKTDDDMFINVPRLLSFIKKHEKDTNVIFGRLARKWRPIRNKKSKYYVSQEQFEQKTFPDFTTGPAYLLSKDVTAKLYGAALDETYLKLEDVFITGIIAHKLGIKRVHVSEFLNKKITYSPCNVQRGISIHMVKYCEQFDLWKKLLDGKSKCK
ncbi:beta-1,3-galactosyltransferase 5-like [Chelonus insularis]|uniref:beta-1,3-galactosyltransferase 5-like n=1 Tax=Chelonus insularis TaxID=460826 RepID=UPI00158CC866|nr:beta-1,3-galactosyltransferase 5-like [Chelonus insularis]